MDEQTIGLLCRDGYMTEKYSEEQQDLVHKLTASGVEQVKEILKNPKYQEAFKQMLKSETAGLSKSDQIGVINEIKNMLWK